MTDKSRHRQIQSFIEWMHPQLADFAVDSFDTQGRGVIRIGVPDIAHTALPAPFSTSMFYETAVDLQRLPASGETLVPDRNKAVLLRLVDDYDPPRQAVVVFEFGDADPIIGTIDLDSMLIEEA